eukprot:8073261-Ditylum_brightwellii.AAC.1
MADSRHDQTIVVQDVDEDKKDFWELLGRKGPIKEASEVKGDKMPDKEQTKSQAMITAQNYIGHWDCSKMTTVACVMEGQERKVRAQKKAFK